MKKPDTLLREFMKSLSEGDLDFVYTRSTQNYSGDHASLAEKLEKFPAIDRWFSSAQNADEWYEMVDYLGEFAKKEISRRLATPAN